MSINLPPELSWVAHLTVGQAWPESDEDKLRALGSVWDDVGRSLLQLGTEIGPNTGGVLANLSGAVADQFTAYTASMATNLPPMAEAAGKLGTFSRETATKIEYAKYMILVQLAWLAYELTLLAFTEPEAIPAAITGTRAIVMMILKRLLKAIALGIGLNVGMDVLVQTLQILKGDRTKWDAKSTLTAVETGAIAGAVGGILGGGAGLLAPKFAGSLLGKITVGGLSGIASTVVMNAALGGETDFGGAFTSGLIGSLGGRRRQGRNGEEGVKLTTPDLHISNLDIKEFGNELGKELGVGELPSAVSSNEKFRELFGETHREQDLTVFHLETVVLEPNAAVGAGAGTGTGTGTGTGDGTRGRQGSQGSQETGSPSTRHVDTPAAVPHASVQTEIPSATTPLPGFETGQTGQTGGNTAPEVGTRTTGGGQTTSGNQSTGGGQTAPTRPSSVRTESTENTTRTGGTPRTGRSSTPTIRTSSEPAGTSASTRAPLTETTSVENTSTETTPTETTPNAEQYATSTGEALAPERPPTPPIPGGELPGGTNRGPAQSTPPTPRQTTPQPTRPVTPERPRRTSTDPVDENRPTGRSRTPEIRDSPEPTDRQELSPTHVSTESTERTATRTEHTQHTETDANATGDESALPSSTVTRGNDNGGEHATTSSSESGTPPSTERDRQPALIQETPHLTTDSRPGDGPPATAQESRSAEHTADSLTTTDPQHLPTDSGSTPTHQTVPEAPQAEAPTPTPDPDPGPPAELAGRRLTSLAGVKITNAPDPTAIRERVVTLLGDGRDGTDVRLQLDARLDPASFRKQHAQMVNDGLRFPVRVGDRRHEVLITARAEPWTLQPAEEGAAVAANDGEGFEVTSESTHGPRQIKDQLVAAQSGVNLPVAFTIPHDKTLNVIGSATAAVAGVARTGETSAKSVETVANKVAFTGRTDSYRSRFTYGVHVIDTEGTVRTSDSATEPPAITGHVTADIPRTAPARAGAPGRWTGWAPRTTPPTGVPGTATRTAPPPGHPVQISGLAAVRDAVFAALPEKQRLDSPAHQSVVDFLAPQNVIDNFEHASGWGLISPRMTFKDGQPGFLRLTIEPQESRILGTVDQKSVLGAKSSVEHADNQSDSNSRVLGGSLGTSWLAKQLDTGNESIWGTAGLGLTWTGTQVNGAKGKTTVTTEGSHERSGQADLVATRVRYRVEMVTHPLSARTDGLRGSRHLDVSPPAGTDRAGGTPPDNTLAAAGENTHTVLVVDPPSPAEVLWTLPHTTANTEPGDGSPAAAHPLAPDLVAPRTSQAVQRTSYLEVPGSRELLDHIVATFDRQAPGVLPPPEPAATHPVTPGDAPRVTPKALENLRDLQQQLSPSALRNNAERLADGTLRITLDSSHLPLLSGTQHEILIRLAPGQGHHLGPDTATAKDVASRASGVDKSIGAGNKVAVALSGNSRNALNAPGTVRVFSLAGGEGSGAWTHQVTTGAEREVKREFSREVTGDTFGYPVEYEVLIKPVDPAHPTLAVPPTPHPPTHPPGPAGTSGPVIRVRLDEGRLVVKVGHATLDDAAPRVLTSDGLPLLHLVQSVDNAAAFRAAAGTALGGGDRPTGFRRHVDAALGALAGHEHAPDLEKVLDSLTSPHQLRAAISASHRGWANLPDLHVGSGRRQDAVGLSVRTRLGDLRYVETLPGEGKLAVEIKSGTSSGIGDKTAYSGKVSGGADVGRVPENTLGQQTSSMQIRGGAKVTGSLGRDHNEALREKMSTSRKLTQKGTWHVYEADATLSVRGRIVDADHVHTHGEVEGSRHRVLVLLSDADVHALARANDPATAGHPAPDVVDSHRPFLLDQGIAGGTVAEFRNSDPILKEIDRQLGDRSGPNDDPLGSLRFAETFTPENLAANFDDLINQGIIDHHVEDAWQGKVTTTVLVRGVPEHPWRDLNEHSSAEITRKVTTAQTVKGNSAGNSSLGFDLNARPSYGAPKAEAHISTATLGIGAGMESSRATGIESGFTTKVEHKTAKLGSSLAFETRMRFEVTVTKRLSDGRFVHLPERPRPPAEAPRLTVKAWVPESMTRPEPPQGPGPATVPDHLAQQPPTAPPVTRDLTDPQGFELETVVTVSAADTAAWRASLDSGHDLVGFSHVDALRRTATRVLTTPRPWGTGVVGRAGSVTAHLFDRGAQLVGPSALSVARAVLPTELLTRSQRLVESFVKDPRLDDLPDHPLTLESNLPSQQQAALRQSFSPQSLTAVFHRFQGAGTSFHTPPLGADGRTGLVVSMAPTGPAVEVSTRTTSDDELTGVTEAESSTTATSGRTWTFGAADVSVATDKPIVVVPLNTFRFTGNRTMDRENPVVTRVPGMPDRTLVSSAVPHAKPLTEPGKAEVDGQQWLVRQQVRFSVQKHDGQTYGEAEAVTGDIFYWTTTRPPTENVSPAPPTPAAASPAPPVPVPHAPPGVDTPPPAPPTPTLRPEGIPLPPSPTHPVQPDLTFPAHTSPPAPPTHTPEVAHPPAAMPVPETGTHHLGEVEFTPGRTDLTPDQHTAITTAADHLADLTPPRNSGEGAPLLVTVHGQALVNEGGEPHFGKSLRLAQQHADTVADALRTRHHEGSEAAGAPVVEVRTVAHVGEHSSGELTGGHSPEQPGDRVVLTAEVRTPTAQDTPPIRDSPQDRVTPQDRVNETPVAAEVPVTAEVPVSSEVPVGTGIPVPHEEETAQNTTDIPADAPTGIPAGTHTPPPPGNDGPPPVAPHQWQARRDGATPVTRHTETFRPGGDAQADETAWRRQGRDVLIRNTVRRIQADDGRWVRLISFHLPVRFGEGVSPEQFAGFRQRMTTLLDTHLNTGLRLPLSGDQVHFELALTRDDNHAEAIALTGPPGSEAYAPGRADQLHLDLVHNDGELLHEVLHYAGLIDHYHDPRALLRPAHAGADGLMGHTGEIPVIALSPRDLTQIEGVSNDGTMLVDHPLPPPDRSESHPPGTRPAVVDPLAPNEPLNHPAAQAPERGGSSTGRAGTAQQSPGDDLAAITAAMTGLAVKQPTPDEMYLTFIDDSTKEHRPLAFIVNTITSHTEVGRIREVVDAIQQHLVGFDGRVKIVVGINAKRPDVGALDLAVQTAKELTSDLPMVHIVQQNPMGTGPFKFGTMRNELLDSPENKQQIDEFIADRYHPYISFQDFDTSLRVVPGGDHVFNYFENLLEGSEHNSMEIEDSAPWFAEGITEEFDYSHHEPQYNSMDIDSPHQHGERNPQEFHPVDGPDTGMEDSHVRSERPLSFGGGYRVPERNSAERTQLVADLKARFDNRMPESLDSDEKINTFLDELHGKVRHDMQARKFLAAIAPLLPYTPEPNLFVDAAAFQLRTEGGPRLRFGEKGAEFDRLSKDLNKLYAWELTRRYATDPAGLDLAATVDVPVTLPVRSDQGFRSVAPGVRLERGRDEFHEQVRADAENNRLPVRGRAFVVDFIGGAVLTDVSRIGHALHTSRKLAQDHVDLTGVASRIFETRGAKEGSSVAKVRDRTKTPAMLFESGPGHQQLRDPDHWPAGMPAQNKADAEVSPTDRDQLGNAPHNIPASSISTSLEGTHRDITAGIAPDHRFIATREVAFANQRSWVSRRLAYIVESGHVPLIDEQRYSENFATGLLGTKPDPLTGKVTVEGLRKQLTDSPPRRIESSLYRAVSQGLLREKNQDSRVWKDQIAAAQALRDQVVRWTLGKNNLKNVLPLLPLPGETSEGNAHFEDIFTRLAISGNWDHRIDNDPIPRIIASALNRRINLWAPDPSAQAGQPALRIHQFRPLKESRRTNTHAIDLRVLDEHYHVLSGRMIRELQGSVANPGAMNPEVPPHGPSQPRSHNSQHPGRQGPGPARSHAGHRHRPY